MANYARNSRYFYFPRYFFFVFFKKKKKILSLPLRNRRENLWAEFNDVYKYVVLHRGGPTTAPRWGWGGGNRPRLINRPSASYLLIIIIIIMVFFFNFVFPSSSGHEHFCRVIFIIFAREFIIMKWTSEWERERESVCVKRNAGTTEGTRGDARRPGSQTRPPPSFPLHTQRARRHRRGFWISLARQRYLHAEKQLRSRN